MTNRRRETVGYRRLDLDKQTSEGLLEVARLDGGLERRVAQGLFRLADQAGQIADRQSARRNAQDAGLDSVDGAPGRARIVTEPGAAPEPGAAAGGEAVVSTIAQAARRHGVPVSAMLRTAQLESAMDPQAQNANSSAGGLFQFIDATADEFGLEDRFDAAQAADAAARLMARNRKTLEDKLGRPPTDGELYLAHQQGAAGALRLLTDRGRPVSAVIGEDAARLNAGADGMTAGEFADLWIARAESVRPPSPPAAGSAVPLDHQAPGVVRIEPGKQGTWRPSGRDTIAGRAYDAAGTKTYLQMLDATMRADMQAVYEATKDDPAALREKLDALLTVHLDPRQGHVFPEIEASYRANFARARLTLEEQADRRADRRRREADHAEYLTRTNELSTVLARQLADFDVSAPSAASAIAGAQAAIDAHYQAAVARGVLTESEAAEATMAARRRTAVAFYTKQAEALDAEDVAALRRQMRADFADGALAGVDGTGWQELDAALIRIETDKRAGNSQADAAYRNRAERFLARVQSGFDIDQGEWSQFELDAGTAPNGPTIRAVTGRQLTVARALRDETLADGVQRVQAMRAALGRTPDDADLAVYDFAVRTLEAKRQKLDTDPIGYAEAAGIVDATPSVSEIQTADDLSDLIAQRVVNGDLLSAHYGVPARHFRPGEAAMLRKLIRSDPEQGSAMAAAIISGAGDRTRSVLAELGDAAPEIAQAGVILAGGGSAQAAADVLAGHGKDDAGKPYKPIDHALRAEIARDVAGSAVIEMPANQARIENAAHAIARKRIAEAGVDPDSRDARAIFERALHEAAGAVHDGDIRYGGFGQVGAGWFDRREAHTVLVPNTIRADLFDDVVRAIRPADLEAMGVRPVRADGTPVSAAGLAHTVPVAVPDGYMFVEGDPADPEPRVLYDEQGNVFVLDIAAMASVLGPRVPGAYRGW